MNKIIILGHINPDVDSIVSGYILEKILTKKGYNVEFVIPDKKIEEDTLNICNKYGLNPKKYQKELLTKENSKIILVDHHERDILGNIVCIIDHHPTNKNFNITHYYNNKISSTACFIAQNYSEYLDKKDLLLSIVATIIDTVSFHSNKSRKEDELWAKEISQKNNIDYEELNKEGIRLTPLDNIDKISLNGLKKHIINNKNIHSSYIQIEKIEDKLNIINKIINNLKEYIIKENIDKFLFLVQNMTTFTTTYYLISKEDIKIKKYDTYLSRGIILFELENNKHYKSF